MGDLSFSLCIISSSDAAQRAAAMWFRVCRLWEVGATKGTGYHTRHHHEWSTGTGQDPPGFPSQELPWEELLKLLYHVSHFTSDPNWSFILVTRWTSH